MYVYELPYVQNENPHQGRGVFYLCRWIFNFQLDSKSIVFRGFFHLLVGSDVKFVVVPFQNLLGRWIYKSLWRSTVSHLPDDVLVSNDLAPVKIWKRKKSRYLLATLSADSSRMAINRFIWSLVRCGRLPFSPRLSWIYLNRKMAACSMSLPVDDLLHYFIVYV